MCESEYALKLVQIGRSRFHLPAGAPAIRILQWLGCEAIFSTSETRRMAFSTRWADYCSRRKTAYGATNSATRLIGRSFCSPSLAISETTSRQALSARPFTYRLPTRPILGPTATLVAESR